MHARQNEILSVICTPCTMLLLALWSGSEKGLMGSSRGSEREGVGAAGRSSIRLCFFLCMVVFMLLLLLLFLTIASFSESMP